MDNNIKIFDGNGSVYIDGAALHQMYEVMKEPWAIKAAIMPDAHLGYSLPIGGVVATDGVVVPAFVGFDIGCGMGAVKLSIKKEVFNSHTKQKIFDEIYNKIPTGFSRNTKATRWKSYDNLPKTDFMANMFEEKGGTYQLGTLGGGNHFIEIGYDENEDVWIVIHSGSRNVGHTSATHYMKLASGDGKAREGTFALDVNSQEGKDYITDLNFCLEFAVMNRSVMLDRVASIVESTAGLPEDFYGEHINKNHNHAEFKDGWWIHRKGATHAEKGMLGVIPGNMRDGSFIVEGLGNPDSLCSSSHGAGRVLSRRQAKDTLSLDDFESHMDGIVANVDSKRLDESPDAYKSIFEVMDAQKDLVKVLHHIKPLINIKG